MKILLFSIALLSYCASANAQLKTYSGSFKIGEDRANGIFLGRNGKVTYSYKEVNDERIKEGKFSFYTDEQRQSITITGDFKNGKKTGHWKTVTQGIPNYYQNMMNSLDANCNAFDVLITNGVKTIMEGNYLDGKRTGKWTFSKTDLGTGTTYRSEASFKDGKFYGPFAGTYHVVKMSGDIIYYKDISVRGQFVEGGLPDSTWKAKWTTTDGIENVSILTFDKGKAISFKATDLSTGEDISKSMNIHTDIFKHNPNKIDDGEGIKPNPRAMYIPMPFQKMLTVWFVDESLLTMDRDEIKILFLNWN